jgi:hypothetical protein
MTDTKMSVPLDRQLKGKANFISWKRHFERAAKALDVLDLLTGKEEVLEKPQRRVYFHEPEIKVNL